MRTAREWRTSRHATTATTASADSCSRASSCCTTSRTTTASRGLLKRNRVRNNDEACEGHPDGGEPPLSGAGIVLLGPDRVVVSRNRVLGNEPSGDSAFSGGIVVLSSADPDLGGDDANDNTIVRNVAFGNDPFDIFWDGTGVGNLFARNHCGTSDPSWI